jgi:hypothetical protein
MNDTYTLENAEKEAKIAARETGKIWSVIQCPVRKDRYDFMLDSNVHKSDTVISSFMY